MRALSYKLLDFSVFNDTSYPSHILIFCDNAILEGLLDYNMFAGLHAFTYLKIKDCRITNVTSQAFKGMISLKTLIIEGGQNTVFDTDCLQVPDVSNLEVISITSTNTKAVPSMCNLDRLWMVNISHNEIEDFADTGLMCDKPTNVQIIDISHNKLHDIARDFSEITNNLLLLSASWNLISHISPSVFTHMANLEVVQLDNNRIFRIPRDIFHYNTKITTLSLSHNYIKDIHENLFSELENLNFLRLETMVLDDHIWKGLAHLKELKALFLSNNSHITNVSKTVIQNFTKLQILDISGNNITCISNGTFEKQKEMRLLNISENNLQTLYNDSFNGLSNLTTLDLKHNDIIHIQHDALLPLTSLRTLNLSFNHMQEAPYLPVSIWGLDLRHNDITSVGSNSFSGLVNLKGINMRNNKVKTLPKNVFNTNKNLQLLDLSHNSITKIEYQSFPENSPLEVLILNHNKIDDIVTSFAPTYFSNLRVLDLKYNVIKRLMPPMVGGLFPSSVEELFLSWNEISVLGGFIFKLPNLRVVDLKGNNISAMSNLVLKPYPNKISPVTFYLANNPFNCDCKLVWIKDDDRVQSAISRTSYIIRDFSALYCQHTYRHPNDFLENIPVDKFLCEYKENCFAGCNCCYEEQCSCKTYCPTNCTCYHSRNPKDVGVIDCVDAHLTSIPESVSQGSFRKSSFRSWT